MRFAQLVLGPAGAGKSTYCALMQEHGAVSKRVVHVVNLDPAAEHFGYEPSVDIRELVSLDEVMDELGYGPNGGLIYCMEYLLENLDWLEESLDMLGGDAYVIIDCPGQVELFTHIPVMRTIVERLTEWGFRMAAVYCLESVFMSDASKFISGSLLALSTMVQLELPHINVLTKCDLVPKESIERYLVPDSTDLLSDLDDSTDSRFAKMNAAIGGLLDEYSMVGFVPLSGKDEDAIELVLGHVDHAMQYGEDLEPTEPKDAVAMG